MNTVPLVAIVRKAEAHSRCAAMIARHLQGMSRKSDAAGRAGYKSFVCMQGMLAHTLSCEVYQALLNRGWRRAGRWLYRPLAEHSDCPCSTLHTIRLDVHEFQPNKVCIYPSFLPTAALNLCDELTLCKFIMCHSLYISLRTLNAMLPYGVPGPEEGAAEV